MKRTYTLALTRGGLIAALYVSLTGISAIFGLSSGVIQLRLSEALCVLPLFFPEAVPGLFVGCLVSNLLLGMGIYDILLGSLATLIGAAAVLLFRKLPEKLQFLAPLPTILANALAVPAIIILASGGGETLASFPFFMLTVGIGELISAGGGGIALLVCLRRFFKK